MHQKEGEKGLEKIVPEEKRAQEALVREEEIGRKGLQEK